MNTKIIMVVVLAAVLGGAAGWFAPHQSATAAATASDHKILYYVCPMHPKIKYDHPGNCPICGMTLQPVYADNANTNALSAPQAGCCSGSTNP